MMDDNYIDAIFTKLINNNYYRNHANTPTYTPEKTPTNIIINNNYYRNHANTPTYTPEKTPTNIIKHKSDNCRFCNRKSDDWYFGGAYIEIKRGTKNVHLQSLCKICFEMDIAVADAYENELRFTPIGVGIDGISSYEGNRCVCGCVTHASLRMCIQCSKNDRMLSKMQAENKLTKRLLKELKSEIKSKLKENQNAN